EFLRGIYSGTGILGRSLRSAIAYLGINNTDVEEFFTKNKFPEMDVEIRSGLEILSVIRRLA
ncbi:MAG: hypothetical protein L7G92_03080, partial [Stygiolobus sp.]|nr:hypothetical protein [Stygiolobus sp.]